MSSDNSPQGSPPQRAQSDDSLEGPSFLATDPHPAPSRRRNTRVSFATTATSSVPSLYAQPLSTVNDDESSSDDSATLRTRPSWQAESLTATTTPNTPPGILSPSSGIDASSANGSYEIKKESRGNSYDGTMLSPLDAVKQHANNMTGDGPNEKDITEVGRKSFESTSSEGGFGQQWEPNTLEALPEEPDVLHALPNMGPNKLRRNTVHFSRGNHAIDHPAPRMSRPSDVSVFRRASNFMVSLPPTVGALLTPAELTEEERATREQAIEDQNMTEGRRLGSRMVRRATIVAIPRGEDTVEIVTMDEKTSQKIVEVVEKKKLPFKMRFKKWLQSCFYITDEPELVLASPPTDQEKVSYLEVHRTTLVSFGTLSWLSTYAASWLFVSNDVRFYFLAPILSFLMFYHGLFYYIALTSRAWDYKGHQKIVEDYFAAEKSKLPHIDIMLPVCGEPIEILENTWDFIVKLDWPKDRWQVWILDDGASTEVKMLAAKHGFNYVLRPNRGHLKKAGNIQHGFLTTTAPYFAIFDADFCPRPDFLKELVPRLEVDPLVAIAQSPQYFRSLTDQTWAERGAGMVQEIFFRMMQSDRDKWGSAICVGSNAVYRRTALEPIKGVLPVPASEDMHTGLWAMSKGWKVRYVPLNLACGICPDMPRALFSQQVRWASASTGLIVDPLFWRTKLSVIQRLCFLSGMIHYWGSSIIIFSLPIPSILIIWLKAGELNWTFLALIVPPILYEIWLSRRWSGLKFSPSRYFVSVLQQYAALSAVKDQIVGTAMVWVPSGSKSHKSTRYRNMRLLCIIWTWSYTAAFFTGAIIRICQGHWWLHFLPLMIVHSFLVWRALPFMLAA